jgi:hypothetical protein
VLDSHELNAASTVSRSPLFFMYRRLEIKSEILLFLMYEIMNHMGKAFNLCCAEAYARFTELKRLKVHPGNMTAERDAVSWHVQKECSMLVVISTYQH